MKEEGTRIRGNRGPGQQRRWLRAGYPSGPWQSQPSIVRELVVVTPGPELDVPVLTWGHKQSPGVSLNGQSGKDIERIRESAKLRQENVPNINKGKR